MGFIQTLLPALMGGAGTAAAVTASDDASKKAEKKAQTESDRVKAEAEAKSLLAAQEEEKTQKARAALLARPTQGFGANTNLPRSFLTSL